jgi:putative heme-binding domain-containing protein
MLGATCAIVCALCLPVAARAQALPDGKGKVEFVHNCTACHRADMVTRVKKTPDEWKKNVFEMAARGTDGTKADLDNVVLYLDEFYATDKPASAAPAPSTAPAPAAGTSPDNEHVKQLITDSLCLTCHRIEHQGAFTAPSLNGVGARATPAEIRASIASPPAALEPAYTLVKLTTADGKTLTGRVLHQDEQQLRVLEPTGEVTDYDKSKLEKFEIINDNPMPAYGHRLSSDDLDSLARYLSALPPIDDGVHK